MRAKSSRGKILSGAMLEIEWNAELAKLFLLFPEIFVAEFLESAVFFENDEKGVDLRLQSLIVASNSNSPALFLKRFQNGFGAVLMLLPVLEDGHLVINERLSLILHDFQNACVFFFKDKDASAFEMLLGVKLAGGPLFNGDTDIGLVRLGDRVDLRGFVGQDTKASA